MQHIGIQIVNEDGSLVSRFNGNFLEIDAQIMTKIGECGCFLLQGIDPFGDTVFNSKQVIRVINELNILKTSLNIESSTKLIDEIIGYLKKITEHQYLKFIGD
jgi:hypothetical protein